MFCLADSIPGIQVLSDDAANGEFYGIRSYRTIWGPPDPPALLSPLNGSTQVSLTPTLQWTSQLGAYNVVVTRTPAFSNQVLYLSEYGGTSYTIPPGLLNYDSTYYWKVQTIDAHGASNWSTQFSFRTLLSGITQYGTGIPDKYFLYDNFPNPFNPSTKIRFDLPEAANVRLVVYDISGRVTKRIVNEKLSPGKYVVDFTAESISSGIYFCRMETDNFAFTKKMLVIK